MTIVSYLHSYYKNCSSHSNNYLNELLDWVEISKLLTNGCTSIIIKITFCPSSFSTARPTQPIQHELIPQKLTHSTFNSIIISSIAILNFINLMYRNNHVYHYDIEKISPYCKPQHHYRCKGTSKFYRSWRKKWQSNTIFRGKMLRKIRKRVTNTGRKNNPLSWFS